MKLAVLCSTERISQLPTLREAFDGLLIETLAWYRRDDWTMEEAVAAMEQCLEYSSYVLCLISPCDALAPWLHFALGYQRGQSDGILFWLRPEDAPALPPWMRRYPVVFGNELDVAHCYEDIERRWNEEANARLAKQEISHHGREVSARAFVEAVREGNRFLVGQYLEAGFSPELRDGEGVPILNHAIRSRNGELVPVFLHAGGGVNAIAKDRGTTALMDAASLGDETTMRLLLSQGAELEIVSHEGQTAVILAVGNGKEDCAVLLVEAGANIDVQDRLGMSARKYAELYSRSSVLKAIQKTISGNT
ncbi:MAG: ankyrin repeat domain-containing protein [Spirochaetales bacterium]|nr:ankyrin repeat domain-containing protein [Spirochaetales bacterium]